VSRATTRQELWAPTRATRELRLRPRHRTIASSVNVVGAEAACAHAQRFGWRVRREKVPPNLGGEVELYERDSSTIVGFDGARSLERASAPARHAPPLARCGRRTNRRRCCRAPARGVRGRRCKNGEPVVSDLEPAVRASDGAEDTLDSRNPPRNGGARANDERRLRARAGALALHLEVRLLDLPAVERLTVSAREHVAELCVLQRHHRRSRAD